MVFRKTLERKIREKFGDRSKKKSGFNEFAQAISVTRATLSGWLCGKYYPDKAKQKKISRILNWDFSDLQEIIAESRAHSKIDGVLKDIVELNSMLKALPLYCRERLIEDFKNIAQTAITCYREGVSGGRESVTTGI